VKRFAAFFPVVVAAAVALYAAMLLLGWELPTRGHEIDPTTDPPQVVAG
jgi:hypothetical protein